MTRDSEPGCVSVRFANSYSYLKNERKIYVLWKNVKCASHVKHMKQEGKNDSDEKKETKYKRKKHPLTM